MADYKVQMKQYNGTGFDNILPYASQAETLRGGGTASDLIAQARAGLSQIAIGSYVGTGTYGQSNPTVINCGFKPKMVLFWRGPQFVQIATMSSEPPVYGINKALWLEGVEEALYSNVTTMYFTQTSVGLSFYAPDPQYVTYHGTYQNNMYNVVYNWLAIG